MSNDVYTKISEKMRHEQFTDEEIKIVEKAKDQLSNYTTGGSVLGGATGLMLAKAKNFKGFQLVAIATGGFLIGSQVGLIMGAMSSVRTIQSIPNFQRVMHIVQEVRDEAAPGRQGAPRHDHTAAYPSAGHGRFPVQSRGGSELMSDNQVVELQPNPHFQGFKDGDGYHGGNDPSGQRHENNSAWAHAEQRARELQSNSASWSQIRQQNMPKSAWSQVREGKASDAAPGDEQEAEAPSPRRRPGQSSWDRLRQNDEVGFVTAGSTATGGTPTPDGPSEFPRTREDLQSRPARQKNQYGDSF
ncbi:hypothetical protein BGZ74_001335 [Mortierella antarctica]|nr:hypothetical protein BGZ74_001335 [Mortierella antarctica]